ncbi:hypothetical protein Tco_0262430 [Tanacetum coccineum]
MTLDIHNWSSTAHQEIYKILKDETLPIIDQVDARVQNFEIQFLKEADKFVRDYKSLAKEADESLAKHKALEFEIERLLRGVVSQDIMSIGQSTTVVDTSNIQTELDRTKEKLENCIIKKEKEYVVLWNNWILNKRTPQKVIPKVVEMNDLSKPVTLNSVSTPTESKVVTNDKVIDPGDNVIAPGIFRINYFKPSSAKKGVNSNLNGLSSIRVDNTAKTRRLQPRSNTKNDRVPSASKSSCIKNKEVEKFLGTVRFGNYHIAAILGFGDLQWGNILITRVYFVKGLGHNLFLVGKFHDSDLEVAFRRNTCFVRNLEGVDLLKGNRITNLYTINLHDMAYASPICLMARATSTKSWLWQQRLSDLNFDTINDLARNDLATGLPKLKYYKEHLCPSWLSVIPKMIVKTLGNLVEKVTLAFLLVILLIYVLTEFTTEKEQSEIQDRMNVTFDELSAMDFEQRSLKLGL